MKTVNMRTAQATLSAIVKDSQNEPVCLTFHGRPAAMVTGVAGKALEEVLLLYDRRFWAEIDRRTERARKEGVPIEVIRESTRRPRRRRA